MDRKKTAGIVTGAFLVLTGICILGQLAGLWDLSLLMNGWWTLLLIIPAVAGMIVSGPRTGNVLLLLLGVWLFLDCQGWLGDLSWQLLAGIFLIFLGIRAMTGWVKHPHEHHHHHSHRHYDQPGGDIHKVS